VYKYEIIDDSQYIVRSNSAIRELNPILFLFYKVRAEKKPTDAETHIPVMGRTVMIGVCTYCNERQAVY